MVGTHFLTFPTLQHRTGLNPRVFFFGFIDDLFDSLIFFPTPKAGKYGHSIRPSYPSNASMTAAPTFPPLIFFSIVLFLGVLCLPRPRFFSFPLFLVRSILAFFSLFRERDGSEEATQPASGFNTFHSTRISLSSLCPFSTPR